MCNPLHYIMLLMYSSLLNLRNNLWEFPMEIFQDMSLAIYDPIAYFSMFAPYIYVSILPQSINESVITQPIIIKQGSLSSISQLNLKKLCYL